MKDHIAFLYGLFSFFLFFLFSCGSENISINNFSNDTSSPFKEAVPIGNNTLINLIPKLSKVKSFFFEYIAADNVLSKFTDSDVKEMIFLTKKNPNLFYFIFVDKKGNEEDGLYLIYEGNLYLIKRYKELNSGNYKTLESIILDIKSFLDNNGIIYNNKNFYLIIWDHGDAWTYYEKSKAVALDDSSQDWINIDELISSLKYINNNFHKINLLGFDACLMGNVETLYSIFVNNITNYIIASEYYEPGYGWNYDIVFENVSNPYLVGKDFIDAYAYYYRDVFPDNYSLALYEINNTLSYISYINKTAIKLIQLENTSFEVVKTYAAKFRIDFKYSYLMDSYMLLNNSAKDLGFTFNYTNFPVYLKTNLPNMKGATISFPSVSYDINYFSLYYVNSTINPFVNTNYGKFIKDYLNFSLN